MKSFTDMKGRTWEIAVTIAGAKRCRDLLDVNLIEMGKSDEESDLLTRLGFDAILLVDVIFVLCKPQADEKKVSDVDFGESMGGEAIQTASIALYEELIDFFLKCGRKDKATAVQKMRNLVMSYVNAMDEKMQAVDLEAPMQKAVDREFGKLSTDLQVLSESTPDP